MITIASSILRKGRKEYADTSANLAEGDTVGIVTLGTRSAAGIINARIEYLRAMELNVVLGQYVYAQNGFLAGTDERRASDLMRMFLR